MNLTSPSQVRALLERLDIKPSSGLGQCFLIDANIRDIIVAASGVGLSDTVLEIGPGLGVLTEALVRTAGRVIAVEKDGRLAAHLRERFAGVVSLDIRQADFLELDPRFIISDGVTAVVSNLPYSVGSRMLMEMFALTVPPVSLTVTVQAEVGERLAAPPGDSERGLLSVWAQRAYRVEIRKIVSAACFCPRPKVQSAVVHLARRDESERRVVSAPLFMALTKGAFAYRRKQMGTILARIAGGWGLEHEAALAALSDAGIEARTRPETLDTDAWRRLADGLTARGAKAQEGIG